MPRLIDADVLRSVFTEKSSERVCGIKLCKAIIYRIDHTPTVDAVPVWIPMHERKPKVGQDVLVTTKNGRMYVVTYAFIEWIPGHCFHWKPYFMGTEYLDENDVIAWMPLPKPFQEDKR